MTAQIAILTSACAVLAADSAVTISRGAGAQKVYTGMDKIFSLSDEYPAAALTYGNANLLDVPWGTLLSEYRHDFGASDADDLETLAESLQAFFAKRLSAWIDRERDNMLALRARGLFEEMVSRAREWFLYRATTEAASPGQRPSTVAGAIGGELARLATDEHGTWSQAELLPGISEEEEKRLHRELRPLITKVRRASTKDVEAGRGVARRLTDIALFSLTRKTPEQVQSPVSGGLVVVGFPRGSFWPEYIELTFDGLGPHGIRTWESSRNRCQGPGSVLVRPFAQRDGVQTIMEGVHSQMLSMLDTRLSERGVADSVIAEAFDEARQTWADQRTMPILRTLDVMPPPDLCEVAESLVSITGLWQRMRGTLETVGGTVSVAVLAPGQPLRWAKRPALARA